MGTVDKKHPPKTWFKPDLLDTLGPLMGGLQMECKWENDNQLISNGKKIA